MSKEIIWKPSKDLVENSKLTKFLNFSKIKDYNELEKKSLTDPGWLWDSVIKFSDLKFFEPYSKIIDESKGIPWTRWCVDGRPISFLIVLIVIKTKIFLRRLLFFQSGRMEQRLQLPMKNLIKEFQK